MALAIYLIGAPGSGKSEVFNALTMTTTGPHSSSKGPHQIGSVKVPDDRMTRLREMYHPKKYTPAEVTFLDVAPPRGRDGTAGLGKLTEVLSEADAFALVVQCFGGLDYRGQPVDPCAQMESVLLELIVTDLEKVERRLERIKKEKRSNAKVVSSTEIDILNRFLVQLEAGKPLRDVEIRADEERHIRHYQFLSIKPILIVANVSEDAAEQDGATAMEKDAVEQGMGFIRFCAPLESEIAQLDDDMRTEFMRDYHIETPARDLLIQEAYGLLNLISFFTVGEDEVRAWTVPDSATAYEAAGKIHSDIQRGFIRAETISSTVLLDTGTWAACRDHGTLRLEGKEYRVRDGEVIHFRFNV